MKIRSIPASPSRQDWADFRNVLDADFDHFEDEAPELDDLFYYDPTPEEWAWLTRQHGDAGFPEGVTTPADVECWSDPDDPEPDDAAYDDHPHGAFLGEVA